MRIVSRLLLAAAVSVLGAPPAAPAPRSLPAGCPAGRFTVATPPIVTGGAAFTGGTLTISDGDGTLRVALGTACPAAAQVRTALARRRKGARLAVTWSACEGVRGRVRLRGVLGGEGCGTFSGTLRARGTRLRIEATRAPVACGDAIVDAGEACDPRSETPGCPAGQGCVRAATCACAGLCGGTQPGADALDAALRAGLAAEPEALRDPAAFDRLRGGVQAALGCALNPGSLRSPAPDPLPAPGGYDSSRQYCGPGDSAADWRLALVAPEPCLNVACFEHDGCTARGEPGCDAALLAACETCAGPGGSGLFTWLTPDSYVVCAALRLALASGIVTTTTTTSAPPATLPGATSTSTSQPPPGPTTTSTSTPPPTSSTVPAPTVTSTTSTTSSTALTQGKDLVPENVVLATTEVPAGGSVSVTWDVKNRGTVAVTESWCDKLWLSADAALDASDVMVESQCHFGTYQPGQGDRRTLAVPIPGGVPPGPAHLLVETDVQFTVTEGNETNNVAAAPFTITAGG